MEELKKFAAPAFGALVLLLILFLCKSSPVSKLWKGYTTLSVPVQADEKLVGQLLREMECGQYISLEGQPAANFFEESYSSKKSLYFFDREKTVRIYYIPDARAKQAAAAARLLQSRHHIDAVLGSQAAFPYLAPLVCLLALFALVFFCQNKGVFLASALPLLFYAFCNPFYAAAASVCLEYYALYLGQRLWRRRGALQALLANSFIVVFSAAALALSAAAGFARALFFLLSLASSFSILFLFFNMEKRNEKSARFLPVLIRSARAVNPVGAENLRKAFFSSAEIFLLFALLCAGTDFLSSGGKRGLFFPAPTEYNESRADFPTMEDYFASKWNGAAFQYRSLNKSYPLVPKEGDAVEMTRYEKTGKGIQSRVEKALVYDKAFKKEAAAALDKTESPLLEKLWKAQGKRFSVVYASGGSESAGAGLAAALLLAALLPLLCGLAPRFKFKAGRI